MSSDSDYLDIWKNNFNEITNLYVDPNSGEVKKLSFKGNNFYETYNLYNKKVQLITGFHPPEDLNNPNSTVEEKVYPEYGNIKTTLLKPGDTINFGKSLLNVPNRKLKILLPPGTKSVETMKFFLVQNYAFTIAMKLNKKPLFTTCNSSDPSDPSVPCIIGGSLFSTYDDFEKFKQGEEVIFEKYLSESVEPKFFNLDKYLKINRENFIYVNVLRNQYNSISKFEYTVKIDAYTYLEYLNSRLNNNSASVFTNNFVAGENNIFDSIFNNTNNKSIVPKEEYNKKDERNTVDDVDKVNNKALEDGSKVSYSRIYDKTGDVKPGNEFTDEDRMHDFNSIEDNIDYNRKYNLNNPTIENVERKISNAEVKKTTPRIKSTKTYADMFQKYWHANLTAGAHYAVFRVDYSGPVSESFSNSFEEPAIKSFLNGISNTSRAIKFNLVGANLMDGFLADSVEAAMSGVARFLQGGLSGLTLGLTNIIPGLLGGANFNIPKTWSDSNFNPPSITYKTTLISPYNHPYSLLQNIYIPLAMLLAGTLPRATGGASYTSPFLCQLFNRGKQQIKLGMISSLSITRGTSNLGFSDSGKPLAVDVSFTVTDLSEALASQVGSIAAALEDYTEDDDNAFSNYLQTITGMDLYSIDKYAPRIVRNIQKVSNLYTVLSSPSFWGSFYGNDGEASLTNFYQSIYFESNARE